MLFPVFNDSPPLYFPHLCDGGGCTTQLILDP